MGKPRKSGRITLALLAAGMLMLHGTGCVRQRENADEEQDTAGAYVQSGGYGWGGARSRIGGYTHSSTRGGFGSSGYYGGYHGGFHGGS